MHGGDVTASGVDGYRRRLFLSEPREKAHEAQLVLKLRLQRRLGTGDGEGILASGDVVLDPPPDGRGVPAAFAVVVGRL